MEKRTGPQLILNVFRPSAAAENVTSLFGPSRQYETEQWLLDYYSVDEYLDVSRKKAACFLPKGYEDAFLRYGDDSRREGPMYKVRAWGVEFLTRYLEFCPEYLRVRNERVSTVAERARWDLLAVGWDLPGHFIIASDDHPFTAVSPAGKEYVYDYWCRYYDAALRIKERQAEEAKESGKNRTKTRSTKMNGEGGR